jgi:hypothetical protein
MTNRARRRRADRLEEEARAFVSRTHRADVQTSEYLRGLSFRPMASVCLLTLYGKPQIEESLVWSWDRVRKSVAWRACREEHPDFAEYGREDKGELYDFKVQSYQGADGETIEDGTRFFQQNGLYIATPFDRLGARYIADYFRKYFLPDLPGRDETAKLSAVFERVPPWLSWFTHGDVAAAVLGLTFPDLTSMRQYDRGKLNLDRLPEGPFELNVRPDGVEDQFYKKADDSRRLPDGLTPHERRRAIRVMSEFGNRLGR